MEGRDAVDETQALGMRNSGFSGGRLKHHTVLLLRVYFTNILLKLFTVNSLGVNLRKRHPPLLLSNGCTHLCLSGILF